MQKRYACDHNSYFTSILLVICQSYIPDKPMVLAPNMMLTNILVFWACHNMKNV